MPQQDERPQYDETVDPQNPPEALTRPAVGRAAIGGFLGSAVVFFIIVAAALFFWMANNRRIEPDPGARETEGFGIDRDRIGTAGERSPGTDLPGGSNPDPRPGNTRDEIEFRGGDVSSRSLPLTNVAAILDDRADRVAGRRVELAGSEVAATGTGTFWIHDGNNKIEVIAPAGAPSVRSGQRVDVVGTVEANGQGGMRIRADRVR